MSDDNIPMKESKHGGIPVTDVESAQRALLDSMRASKEQPKKLKKKQKLRIWFLNRQWMLPNQLKTK